MAIKPANFVRLHGWVQPWTWTCYHYYLRSSRLPLCGDRRATKEYCLSNDMYDVFPSPEFLELFEAKTFRVCKKCYKKLMRMQK